MTAGVLMATPCSDSQGGQRYVGMYGTGILFEEPNPTGSRPRDLIGLYKHERKPHPPNAQDDDDDVYKRGIENTARRHKRGG